MTVVKKTQPNKKAQWLWKLLNCVFTVEGERNLRLSIFHEVFAMKQASQINIIVPCEPAMVNATHKDLLLGKTILLLFKVDFFGSNNRPLTDWDHTRHTVSEKGRSHD